MRIGNNTVKDIDVTVSKLVKNNVLFGENTLIKFGKFTVDTKGNKFIF